MASNLDNVSLPNISNSSFFDMGAEFGRKQGFNDAFIQGVATAQNRLIDNINRSELYPEDVKKSLINIRICMFDNLIEDRE